MPGGKGQYKCLCKDREEGRRSLGLISNENLSKTVQPTCMKLLLIIVSLINGRLNKIPYDLKTCSLEKGVSGNHTS